MDFPIDRQQYWKCDRTMMSPAPQYVCIIIIFSLCVCFNPFSVYCTSSTQYIYIYIWVATNKQQRTSDITELISERIRIRNLYCFTLRHHKRKGNVGKVVDHVGIFGSKAVDGSRRPTSCFVTVIENIGNIFHKVTIYTLGQTSHAVK